MSSESGTPSDTELAEALAPFLAVNQVVVKPVSTLSLVYFIYGFYAALFSFCLHTLTRPEKKGERSNRKCHLGWVVSLFLLASTTVVFYTVFHIHDSLFGFAAVKTKDYEPFIDYLNGDRVNYADFRSHMVDNTLVDVYAKGLSPVDLSTIPIQAAVCPAFIRRPQSLTLLREQGIAPTLIIVRTAIGKSVESVNQVVSTLRFAEGAGGDGDTNGRGGQLNRGRNCEKSDIHSSDLDLESTQSDLAAGRANGLRDGTM
ncbi:hypothetical protein PQX77_016761 [Marasmius sp. AFHP31]|nr:hypothetical protein PQX77_016761 [Marasmius sp. AFHP31]